MHVPSGRATGRSVPSIGAAGGCRGAAGAAIEAEYRWALEAAELEWTRRLIADIKSGSLDALELWRGFPARRD